MPVAVTGSVDIPYLEISPFTDKAGRVHGNSPFRLSLGSDPFATPVCNGSFPSDTPVKMVLQKDHQGGNDLVTQFFSDNPPTEPRLKTA